MPRHVIIDTNMESRTHAFSPVGKLPSPSPLPFLSHSGTDGPSSHIPLRDCALCVLVSISVSPTRLGHFQQSSVESPVVSDLDTLYALSSLMVSNFLCTEVPKRLVTKPRPPTDAQPSILIISILQSVCDKHLSPRTGLLGHSMDVQVHDKTLVPYKLGCPKV